MANKRVSDELADALAAKVSHIPDGAIMTTKIADGAISTTNKSHAQLCGELRNLIRAEIKCSMQSHEVADLIYHLCNRLDTIERRNLEEVAYATALE